MSEQKKKEEVFTSPKGIAKYPHLTKPQTQIQGKAVKPTYAVTLLLDPNDEASVALVDKIKAAHAAGYAAAKKANPKKKYNDMGVVNMLSDDTDKDGEPTGKLAVKFKTAAGGTRKDGSTWTFKPALFDSKGQGLPADAPVYGGSVIKVAYSIRHTAMETGAFYTTLNLKAVQGITIVSSYQRDAGAYGFGNEDNTDAFGEEANAEASGADQSPDF
jgi:hypothetical protein